MYLSILALLFLPGVLSCGCAAGTWYHPSNSVPSGDYVVSQGHAGQSCFLFSCSCVDPGVCTKEKLCQCPNGQATRGAQCATQGSTSCKSCNAGYVLHKSSCVLNACSCSNGAPVDAKTCLTHGNEQCKSCNTGYDLLFSSCVLKACTCSNGTPADAKTCSAFGTEQCKSCNTGYVLTGGLCVKTSCRCANGVAATKCAAGEEKCVSCNTASGFSLHNGVCASAELTSIFDGGNQLYFVIGGALFLGCSVFLLVFLRCLQSRKYQQNQSMTLTKSAHSVDIGPQPLARRSFVEHRRKQDTSDDTRGKRIADEHTLAARNANRQKLRISSKKFMSTSSRKNIWCT